PPLETPSGIQNSSFMSIRGFPSTAAENSPPLSASLPDLSITDEELTSDRSSPNSEKYLLDGGFSTKPNDTVHSSSSEKGGESYGKSVFSETKACDYTEGKWVEDSHRPLYSGKMCKHWLSEMWACRLTQWSDFSYENYRWQPDNCDMPEFEGHEFLK
ncbi:hypothetical protein KI387_030969, partial [Taxus chinensis]